MYKWRQ